MEKLLPGTIVDVPAIYVPPEAKDKFSVSPYDGWCRLYVEKEIPIIANMIWLGFGVRGSYIPYSAVRVVYKEPERQDAKVIRVDFITKTRMPG